MAKKSVAQQRLTKLDIYLYIPNMIGYIRVLMNRFAFAQCFSNKQLFSVLYFISFVCDGVDGWCARKFNQGMRFCVSCDMSFYWRSMSFMHIHTCTNKLLNFYTDTEHRVYLTKCQRFIRQQ
ncbi:probable CDP-diacylglycerol--inositol 3-phosphatidyltransferase 2 isoform X2 [Malus sylvestris]|uniref:probable CDP-diacylglycerol--inositol 3-phosphatidyltransferase 2 isoform X2 n=1 Tax=Malus sylvestris TaxID=3752 RepID=UPI0021ACF1A3|nr:probable CDP-diacylglycerol--inositol 3-phosphatidyltransferase 2 isoform X2 [Malus sylvestris]XP_050132333.1 probable CDP-diacylglycerol--inositol 3-phosphatidyltransferase 2 isoform X2 [Malus sylvestris]XP_050132334.1 probable CDP-diacylglycerol--inositol 3-phosphatidyltransferase 2 isoform X2 [Malus sylvestris]XP_050132335.1 probable CDP-diacylglycerol--inositol 3-phosphatidyltransferase 2 isoform X2 [Malus sylvestris]